MIIETMILLVIAIACSYLIGRHDGKKAPRKKWFPEIKTKTRKPQEKDPIAQIMGKYLRVDLVKMAIELNPQMSRYTIRGLCKRELAKLVI